MESTPATHRPERSGPERTCRFGTESIPAAVSPASHLVQNGRPDASGNDESDSLPILADESRGPPHLFRISSGHDRTRRSTGSPGTRVAPLCERACRIPFRFRKFSRTSCKSAVPLAIGSRVLVTIAVTLAHARGTDFFSDADGRSYQKKATGGGKNRSLPVTRFRSAISNGAPFHISCYNPPCGDPVTKPGGQVERTCTGGRNRFAEAGRRDE